MVVNNIPRSTSVNGAVASKGKSEIEARLDAELKKRADDMKRYDAEQ